MKQHIIEGNTSLGIELGSTRIKAVLIGPDHTPPWPAAGTTGKTGWKTATGPTLWTPFGRDCRTPLPNWPPRCCGSTACPLKGWAAWAFPP